jgi:acetone carboxylase gamma subunit
MSRVAELEQSRALAGATSAHDDAFVFCHEEIVGWQLHCADCDHHYGPAARDPKLAAAVRESSLSGRLVAREFFCPSCALLIAVDVQQPGDPLMLAWDVDPARLGVGA